MWTIRKSQSGFFPYSKHEPHFQPWLRGKDGFSILSVLLKNTMEMGLWKNHTLIYVYAPNQLQKPIFILGFCIDGFNHLGIKYTPEESVWPFTELLCCLTLKTHSIDAACKVLPLQDTLRVLWRFLKEYKGSWGGGSEVKNIFFSSKGPEFNWQHPHKVTL